MIKTLTSLQLGKTAEVVTISGFILSGFRTYATLFFLIIIINHKSIRPMGFGEHKLHSTPWGSDASAPWAFG